MFIHLQIEVKFEMNRNTVTVLNRLLVSKNCFQTIFVYVKVNYHALFEPAIITIITS